MFIAAPPAIARKQAAPVSEWLTKVWYVYTMEFCSAIKN